MGKRPKPFVLVASEFNPAITRALVEGAQAVLRDHGVARRRIRTLWVPGVFELPVAAAAAARRLRPEAIIAVGCVIKGQTPQYAALGQAAVAGLTQVSVSTRIPVTCGVIIAESTAQAAARAGGRAGHRGREAALAAVAMANLL
ncbi:MAG: 6,7-dimethyl-8-ribityllumazine synthase, partial [Candidatus Omnitrophica bacterium]|nr:6,7-dimethyl-8-ribityllumazine synthase [Candidatus Omnitrophota bacterium]